MNFRLKTVVLGLCVGLLMVSPLTAYASESSDETLGEELQRDAKWLYDKAKEKLPEAASKAKEKAGEITETVKEKAPEYLEKAKEKAPEVAEDIKSGVNSAGEAISEYRDQQEDEFMDWFEEQTNTGEKETETPVPSEEEFTPLTNDGPVRPTKSEVLNRLTTEFEYSDPESENDDDAEELTIESAQLSEELSSPHSRWETAAIIGAILACTLLLAYEIRRLDKKF